MSSPETNQRCSPRLAPRTAAVTVSWLWLGTVLGAALGFATQVLLARFLTVEEFGAFSSALALVTVVAPLAGFGMGGYWLNIFGKEGWNAVRWLSASLWFLLISSATVMIAVCIWALYGPHGNQMSQLIIIVSFHILGVAAIELTSAKFQLEARNNALAIWQLVPHLSRFSLVLPALLLTPTDSLSAVTPAWAFAFVSLCLLIFSVYQIIKMLKGNIRLEGHLDHGLGKIKADQPGPWDVALNVWPFGLSGLFFLIYYQSDIIILRYLDGDVAAGIYNVAFVVMGAVYLFPGVLYQKYLLPKLQRWAHHDKTQFISVYRKGSLLMLASGLATTVVLLIAVPILLPLVFGADYNAAVHVLGILSFAAPFRFLSIGLGAFLSTRNFMRRKVRLMGYASLVNIGLNFILIPYFGLLGAAVATLTTEILLFTLYFLLWLDVKAHFEGSEQL